MKSALLAAACLITMGEALLQPVMAEKTPVPPQFQVDRNDASSYKKVIDAFLENSAQHVSVMKQIVDRESADLHADELVSLMRLQDSFQTYITQFPRPFTKEAQREVLSYLRDKAVVIQYFNRVLHEEFVRLSKARIYHSERLQKAVMECADLIKPVKNLEVISKDPDYVKMKRHTQIVLNAQKEIIDIFDGITDKISADLAAPKLLDLQGKINKERLVVFGMMEYGNKGVNAVVQEFALPVAREAKRMETSMIRIIDHKFFGSEELINAIEKISRLPD